MWTPSCTGRDPALSRHNTYQHTDDETRCQREDTPPELLPQVAVPEADKLPKVIPTTTYTRVFVQSRRRRLTGRRNTTCRPQNPIPEHVPQTVR